MNHRLTAAVPFSPFARLAVSLMTRALSTALILVGLALNSDTVQAQQWVASWASSHQGPSAEDETLTNATVRMIARSTVAGDQLRVRLENTFGTAPVAIGAASVGLQNRGAVVVAGSMRPLRFSGSTTVTIAAGDAVMSDPVLLPVEAEQGLAVSVYVPGTAVRSSVHGGALTTSYFTEPGAGDRADDEDGAAFTRSTSRMHWLSAIEVFSSSARGAIVALGDSITDGSCATVDGHDRWEDVLYDRLLERAGGTAGLAMINAGIGGNTLVREGLDPSPTSATVLERLERDVLSLAGVTHVILFIGTNDIRRGGVAAPLIAGMREVIRQVRDRGIRIVVATIIPRNPEPRAGLPPGLGFDAAKNAERHAVNEWIRAHDDLDAVIDFDEVVKHSRDRDLINPVYDCDGIHPNVFGYTAMGRSIDLTVFEE